MSSSPSRPRRRPPRRPAGVPRFVPPTPYDYPYDVVADRLALLGRRLPSDRSDCTVLCTGHVESRPSLSVGESDDGHVLLYCHAGCPLERILEPLELKKSQLFLSEFTRRFGRPRPGHDRRVVTPHGSSPGHSRDGTSDAPTQRFAMALGRLERGPAALAPLAAALQLPAGAIADFGVGYDVESGAYVFREQDHTRATTGLLFRTPAGRKSAALGSRRGLTLPRVITPPGPRYVAEGATDAIALHAAGLGAVGRPAAAPSADVYQWLRGYLWQFHSADVVIIGDNDRPDAQGKRVGQDAARDLAGRLAADGSTHRAMAWAVPAGGHKDVRAMYAAGGPAGVRFDVTPVRVRKGVPW